MQITYDTTTDTLAKVLAVTHAAFGVPDVIVKVDAADAIKAVEGAISAADNPETGLDVTQKDKDGLPWDARVHSTPPSMTDKGVWRAKRGRKDEEYAAVRAEYQPAPAAAAAPPQPAAPAMPPAPAPLAPAPAAKTPYQKLADFLAEAVEKGTGGATAQWVKESLAGMGVADGNIVNLQGADEEQLEKMLDAFKSALGVA